MPPLPPRGIIDHRPRDFWSVKNHPLSGITTAQWARMLWRHGRSVDVFTYWPRLLFITCMSVLNAFFALCDCSCGRAVRNQELNDEPVFVLGHPRTGTTHLHNLLSKDERFASRRRSASGSRAVFCASALSRPSSAFSWTARALWTTWRSRGIPRRKTSWRPTRCPPERLRTRRCCSRGRKRRSARFTVSSRRERDGATATGNPPTPKISNGGDARSFCF